MSNDNTSSVQERAKPPPTASNLQPHSPPASDKMLPPTVVPPTLILPPPKTGAILGPKPNIVSPEKPCADRLPKTQPLGPPAFIEESVALLEKYIASRDYKPKSFVDKFDQNSNCWRVAIVLQRNETTVDITYEGWSTKYDENKIHVNDKSLGAYRKYTVGYTGQSKQAFRNFSIKEEELTEMIEMMKEQIRCNFSFEVNSKLYTPWQWTQKFRGRLFVYLDSVFTLMHFYELKDKQREKIDLILATFAEFVCVFIAHCKDWKMYFLASQAKHDLFLVNLNCAIAGTISDIIELLKLLFGSNVARADKSFQALISHLIAEPDVSEPRARQIFVSIFKDKLKSNKFFDMVLETFHSTDYTLDFAYCLLDPLEHLGKNSPKEEYLCLQFFPQLVLALYSRINKPSDEDKNDITKITLKKCFDKLSAMILFCADSNFIIKIKMNIENTQFTVALQSDLLKAKQEGLEKLKSMIGVAQLITDNYYEIKTKEKLDIACKRLTEMNILSALLSKHSHSELVKSAKDIIHLLVIHGEFAEKEVQLFWNQAMTSPEDMKTALLDTLSDIAQYASLALCQAIFRLIKIISFEKYDEPLLTFFTNFTIKIQENEKRKKVEFEKYLNELNRRNEKKKSQGLIPDEADQSKNIEKYELYDVEILWKLIQTGSLKKAIKEKAKKNFMDILAFRKDLIDYFYRLALSKLINNSELSASYMWIMRTIYSKFKQQFKEEITLEDLVKKANFISIIAKKNISYLKMVDEKLSAKYPEGKIEEKSPQIVVAETEFIAGAKHIEQVEEYLNFIDFLIIASNFSSSISNDLFEDLWLAYAGMPKPNLRNKLCSWEREIFFKALQNCIEVKNKKEYTLVSDANCTHLFLNCILNPDRFNLINMDTDAFVCFNYLFYRHNLIKGGMKNDPKNTPYLSNPNLIDGVKELFIIAFNTQILFVEEHCIAMIIQLYQGFIIKTKEKENIIEYYNSFCSYCLEQISKDHNMKASEGKITKFIGMLNQVIKLIEGDKPEKKEDKSKNISDPLLKVTFAYTKDQKKGQHYIYCYENETFADIKKKYSYCLMTPLALLKITIPDMNNLILTSKYDGVLVKVLRKYLIYVEVLPHPFPIEKHPSYAIGNKADLIIRLLHFMSLSEEIAISIWSILKNCHVADNIKHQFLNFCNSPDIQPISIFDFASTRSVVQQNLYCLHVFQRLIAKKAKIDGLKEHYAIYFVARGGFDLIFTSLLSEYIVKPLFSSYIHLKMIKYGFRALTSLFLAEGTANAANIVKYLPDKLKENCIDCSLLCFDIALREMSSKNEQLLACDSKGRPTTKSLFFSKSIRELIKFINTCGAFFLDKSGASLIEKSQIFSQCLSKLSRIEFKGNHRNVVHSAISSQFVLTPKSEGETGYAKYLLKQMLYGGLLGSSNISELKAIYYDILCGLIEISTETTFDVNSAIDNQVMNKLAQIVIEFYKYPEGLLLKYLIKIIEVLLCKYSQKLFPNFSNINIMVNMLIAIISPKHIFEIEGKDNSDTLIIDETKLMANGVMKEAGVNPAALSLLKKLCTSNIRYLHKLANVFAPLVNQNTNWRANTLKCWKLILYNNNVARTEGDDVPYVGLENPLHSCYLNCMLQQFYNITLFRKGVQKLGNSLQEKEQIITANMISSLNFIFRILENKKRVSYDATFICDVIKNRNGKPIFSPEQQTDAGEFYDLFLDSLERVLPVEQSELVRDVFGGEYGNEIISKECKHRSSRKEPWLNLSVEIPKKKSSLVESLNLLFEPEKLEGDNKYLCAECEKKFIAIKRSSIKSLPNILVVVLKRFEFDFDQNKRKKINEYFEFPTKLNMEPYTQEYAWKKEVKEKEVKDSGSLTEEERMLLELHLPENYYEYNLIGVVLHGGDAESGHYTSLILDKDHNGRKDNNSKWYWCDDERVKEFSIESLPQEAFGGREEGSDILGVQGEKQHEMYYKIRNAYLLIYERAPYSMNQIRTVIDGLKLCQNQEEVTKVFKDAKIDKSYFEEDMTGKVSEIIAKADSDDYAKYQLSKAVLNPDFVEFIIDILASADASPIIYCEYKKWRTVDLEFPTLSQFQSLNSAPVAASLLQSTECWKFLLTFVFTVVIRVHKYSKEKLYATLASIKQLLKKNLHLCIWLIETFSHPDILREFLILCPIPTARFFIVSVIITAMQSLLREGEQQKLRKYLERAVAENIDFRKAIIEKKLLKVEKMEEKKWENHHGETVIIMREKSKLPLVLVMLNNLLALLPEVIPTCNSILYHYSMLLSQIARMAPEIRAYLCKYSTLPLACWEILLLNGSSGSPKKKEGSAGKKENEGIMGLMKTEKIIFENSVHKKMYFGFQLIKSTSSSVSSKKDLKHKCQKFLLDLFFNLLKNFIITKSPSSYAENSLPSSIIFTPIPPSLLSYFCEETFISTLINYSGTNLAREATAKIIAHFSWENLGRMQKYLKELLTRYAYCLKAEEFPVLIMAIEELVTLNDSLKLERIKEILKYPKPFLEKYIIQSYFACILFCDMFIRIALRSDYFLSAIQQNPTDYSCTRNWLDDNRYPSKGNIFLLKDDTSAVPLIKDISSEEKAKFKEYTQYRIETLKKLMAKPTPKIVAELGALIFRSEEYPSLIECNFAEDKVIKKKFDVCVKSQWVVGTVKASAEQIILFQYEDSPGSGFNEKWIKSFSEKIQYEESVLKNPSVYIYNLIRKYIEEYYKECEKSVKK